MKSTRTRGRLLLLLALFVAAVPVRAQTEKKIPKPRSLPTGASARDTTQNGKEDRLEIPEVLILGENTLFRNAKSKQINPASDAIMPQETQGSRQFDSQPESGSGEKIPEQKGSPVNHNSLVELRYGTYQSPYIYARHWHQLNRFSFNVEGSFDKSEGQFDNSQFQLWDLNGYFGLQLDPNHRIFGSGYFGSNEYGLWASAFDHQRDWTKAGIQVGAQGRLSPSSQYEVSVSQEVMPRERSIDLLPDSLNFRSIREKNRNIRGKVVEQAGQWQFGGSIDALFNKTESARGSIVGRRFSNALVRLTVELERKIGDAASFSGGLNYQFYDLDSLNVNDSQFRPTLSFSWNLSPRFRISSTYDSFWRMTTRQQLLSINPAANLNFSHSPVEEVKHSFGVNLEWRIDAGSVVNLAYNFQKINNLQIWRAPDVTPGAPDIATNYLFPITSIPEAHLSIFKVSLTSGDLRPYRFRTQLILSGSGIDEFGVAGPSPAETDIPYLEDVRLPVEFEYLVHPDVTVMASGNYLGSRVFETNQPLLGDSFFTLDGRITYRKDFFEAYILVKNLLDQKYEIWNRYPETGIQAFAGVKVKF